MTEFPRIIMNTHNIGSSYIPCPFIHLMTQFKCDHLDQGVKIWPISMSFSPFFHTIKTMQDLLNYPYFFSYQSGKSKFPLLLSLQLHTQLNSRDLLPTVAMISIPLWLLTQYHMPGLAQQTVALRSNFLTLSCRV